MRKLRSVVDVVLASMMAEFDAVYDRQSWPSVPPETLLKTQLRLPMYNLSRMGSIGGWWDAHHA